VSDKQPPQAEILAAIAEDWFTFHQSTEGALFGLPTDEPRIARPLRGTRSVRSEVAAEYLRRYGRPPSTNALGDMLGALEGRCSAADPRPVYLRLAEHDGVLYLDLGRRDGQGVRVDASGWKLMTDYPVTFRRTALTGELPVPTEGGDLAELRGLLNVTEDAWPLVVSWLVASLFPGIPHPILALQGEQGTGKSSAARCLVSTVDPSPAPLRTQPRDLAEWGTVASGSWVVAIDNLSSITDWFSDALCRAVTGDGIVRRALYTDNDLAVMSFRRCVVMTSIDPGALAGDVADRLLVVELERIPEDRRRLDADLAAAWTAVHPRVFGALLDLVSKVQATLPSVTLDLLPRMADFALIVKAVDQLLGTNGLKTYTSQRGSLAAEVVDSDPYASALRKWLDGVGEWTGAPVELVDKVPEPDPKPRKWPRTAKAVGVALRRLAPAFRHLGYTIDRGEQDTVTRRFEWTLRHPVKVRPKGSFGTFEGSRGASEQAQRPEASAEGSSVPKDRNASERGGNFTTLHGSDQEKRPVFEASEGSKRSIAATLNCRACGEPIDPVAGEVHPTCEEGR
jgi:hypothetical protein